MFEGTTAPGMLTDMTCFGFPICLNNSVRLVRRFPFQPQGSVPYVFSKALIQTLLHLPFCGSHESGVEEIFITCLRGKRYRVHCGPL